MNYKLGQFYIGVIDFFATLLPGVFLAFILLWLIGPNDLKTFFGEELQNSVPRYTNVIIFIFVSYVLGRIVDFLGMLILDDLAYPLYENWRPYGIPELKQKAGECLKDFLGQDSCETDTIKWVWVLNRMHSPEALMETEKWEAQARFFGSLSIILFFLPLIYVFLTPYKSVYFLSLGFGFWEGLMYTILFALLLLFCIGYYCSARSRRIRLSYWYFIAFEKCKEHEESQHKSQ